MQLTGISILVRFWANGPPIGGPAWAGAIGSPPIGGNRTPIARPRAGRAGPKWAARGPCRGLILSSRTNYLNPI
jgi:hypothetical protein